MARSRPFAQVDVFSSQAYLGNPAAVIIDADGLTGEQMQRIARWTNLSDTAFILPPTTDAADYRVRIFSPENELPFAGHPTLAAAHAWLEHGGTPRDSSTLVQQVHAGLVEIRRGEGGFSFAAPPTVRQGELDEALLTQFVAAFGVDRASVISHQWVDNGPGWAVVRLSSAQEVRDLDPDFSLIPDAMVGVVGAYPRGAQFDFEMRTFAPAVRVLEDPVCGSMNAAVGQWLVRTGEVSGSYRVSQGARLGRAGAVTIDIDDEGAVWVGGATRTLVRGGLIA